MYEPDFKKGHIDMSKYSYKRWGNPTDDEIKLKLIKRFVGFNQTSTSMKRYLNGERITPDSPDNMLLEFFDSIFPPFIDPKDEIIKREDWVNYEDLLGETLEILNHPVFDEMGRYIRENYQQHSKCLFVSSCGHWKPYSQSAFLQGVKLFYKLDPEHAKYLDTCVLSNSGIIPVSPGNDFSYCYPFRYYDWNHAVEDKKGLREAVEDKMYFYFSELLKAHRYEKVAISSRRVYPSYYNIYKRLEKEFPDIQFLWLQNDTYMDVFCTSVGFPGLGDKYHVVKTRFGQSNTALALALKWFWDYIPPKYLENLKGKGVLDRPMIRETLGLDKAGL